MNTQSVTRNFMRPNFRTTNAKRTGQLTGRQLVLYRAWMASYAKDADHALRDANRNLKGFTGVMKVMLESHQVEEAFRLAIRRVMSYA